MILKKVFSTSNNSKVFRFQKAIFSISRAIDSLIILESSKEEFAVDNNKLHDDWKWKYLYQTFGKRTYGKAKETYILNAIWQRLIAMDIEVQPVTQQVVRLQGKDHSFRLLDLYFPSLKFAIEVDEEGHYGKENSDKQREDEVFETLKKYEGSNMASLLSAQLFNGVKFKRISAQGRFNDIEKQITEVVRDLKNQYDMLVKHDPDTIEWCSPREIQERIKTKREISTKDEVLFSTINEICECISPENVWRGKGTRPSFVELKSSTKPRMLWCPKMVITLPNGKKAAASGQGWENEFIDKQRIKESNTNKQWKDIEHEDRLERVTFMKIKDPLGNDAYRFVGIYVLESNPKNESYERIYKRVGDKYSW